MDYKNKREQADKVVQSLDELFPEDAELSTQPVAPRKSKGGAVGVKVTDSDGEKKENVEYLRVPGMGSVEAVELEDGSWAVTRRDKLQHNKEDKL